MMDSRYDAFLGCVLVFENADTLINAEVCMLLEHRKAQHETDDVDEDQEMSEVFQKTLSHTKRFSKFKNKETIAAVRRWYSRMGY